jgi:hypothetical protein
MDPKTRDEARDDNATAFYQRHCETCRRLGVEPVPLERVRELHQTWDAIDLHVVRSRGYTAKLPVDLWDRQTENNSVPRKRR